MPLFIMAGRAGLDYPSPYFPAQASKESKLLMGSCLWLVLSRQEAAPPPFACLSILGGFTECSW